MKLSGKRSSPFESASSSSSKKSKQPSIRDFMENDPVLNVCAAMVVEDGRPFTNVDSRCMQLILSWGRKGVGDNLKTTIDSVKVRKKVQQEAEELRVQIKKVMATKDGRCFIGKKYYFLHCIRRVSKVLF